MNQTKELDEDVSLSCISPESLPRPRIFWQKDGVDFTGDGVTALEFSEVLTSASISIKKLEYSDAGSYTCCAVNPLLPNIVRKSPPVYLTVNRKLIFLLSGLRC